MSWKDTISNCFKADGAQLGRPWIQEAAAKRMIQAAKSRGAAFEALEREIVWFRYREIKTPDGLQDHITAQLRQADRLSLPA